MNTTLDPNCLTWLDSCNAQQRKAILYSTSPGTHAFVLAGAGSGKTSVLTSRVAHLISQGIHASNILALTFTEKAAGEMQERIERQLKNLEISKSPPEYLGTFHSFAFKVIRKVIDGVPNWQRLGYSQCPRIKDTSDARETASEGAFLEFDEMLPKVLELFHVYPEIEEYYARLFKHILVDEFQDTSPEQLALCQCLAKKGGSLFVVGDDDQAIYGFRGADENSLEQLFKCFPSIDVIKLEINYRSTPHIIAYANTLFKNKPVALQKTLIPGKANGGSKFFCENLPVDTRVFGKSLSEGQWICHEIRQLVQKYSLPYKSVAILYRLNGHENFYRKCVEDNLGWEAAGQIVFQTIHSSKGLQYPIVFLVGLESGTLPYFTGNSSLSEKRKREEKRLFYVGVTRAESHLIITGCKKRFYKGKYHTHKISPYLLESGSLLRQIGLRLRSYFLI